MAAPIPDAGNAPEGVLTPPVPTPDPPPDPPDLLEVSP